MSKRIFIRSEADPLADLGGPFDLVAHVVGMALHLDVDPAVEHLQAEVHLLALGQADHLLQAQHGVFQAHVVGHAAAHAGEGDHVGKAGRGVGVDAAFSFATHSGWFSLWFMPSTKPCADGHGADQAVPLQNVPVLGLDVLDGRQADGGGVPGQRLESHRLEAPVETDRSAVIAATVGAPNTARRSGLAAASPSTRPWCSPELSPGETG